MSKGAKQSRPKRIETVAHAETVPSESTVTDAPHDISALQQRVTRLCREKHTAKSYAELKSVAQQLGVALPATTIDKPYLCFALARKLGNMGDVFRSQMPLPAEYETNPVAFQDALYASQADDPRLRGLVDPVSMSLMSVPITVSSGRAYDLYTVLYLDQLTDPMTREPLVPYCFFSGSLFEQMLAVCDEYGLYQHAYEARKICSHLLRLLERDEGLRPFVAHFPRTARVLSLRVRSYIRERLSISLERGELPIPSPSPPPVSSPGPATVSLSAPASASAPLVQRASREGLGDAMEPAKAPRILGQVVRRRTRLRLESSPSPPPRTSTSPFESELLEPVRATSALSETVQQPRSDLYPSASQPFPTIESLLSPLPPPSPEP